MVYTSDETPMRHYLNASSALNALREQRTHIVRRTAATACGNRA
jgi:hypothetical protein